MWIFLYTILPYLIDFLFLLDLFTISNLNYLAYPKLILAYHASASIIVYHRIASYRIVSYGITSQWDVAMHGTCHVNMILHIDSYYVCAFYFM